MNTGKSLNKYIADKGLCSRRQADTLILEGRVQVNGKDARKGQRVSDEDEVVVDGGLISGKKAPKAVYLAFHKPIGVTCTTNLQDPSNIIDFVGYPQRIFPVGRLDKDSSGLILLTNDGDIVNRILRKEQGKEKEYVVEVDKALTIEFLNDMRNGLNIGIGKTDPCEVRKISKSKFGIILKQGLNRQIRRMCLELGYKVKSLQRTRIMHIELNGIKVGKWRKLNLGEVASLMA